MGEKANINNLSFCFRVWKRKANQTQSKKKGGNNKDKSRKLWNRKKKKRKEKIISETKSGSLKRSTKLIKLTGLTKKKREYTNYQHQQWKRRHHNTPFTKSLQLTWYLIVQTECFPPKIRNKGKIFSLPPFYSALYWRS